MRPKIIICFLLALFLFLSPGIVYGGGRVWDRKTDYQTITNSRDGAPIIRDITTGSAQPNQVKQITSEDARTSTDWLSVVIGSILGFVLSLISVMLIDYLKEPKLIFQVGSIDEDPINKRRFIHVRIKNLKRKHRFSPFVTNPAFGCKAIITIDGKKFIGRWTSKAQPLINTLHGPVVDPNTALIAPREDIQPADFREEENDEQVAVGIKYEGDDNFYGFNNESYLYLAFKNPSRKFGLGKYSGRIDIITLGAKYSQFFIVHNNSGNRSDFYLEFLR